MPCNLSSQTNSNRFNNEFKNKVGGGLDPLQNSSLPTPETEHKEIGNPLFTPITLLETYVRIYI